MPCGLEDKLFVAVVAVVAVVASATLRFGLC